MTNKLARLILLTAMSLLLAACGSDSSDVPSLKATDDTQAVEPTAVVEEEHLDNEAMMMAFTECLRDQGLDVMDPVVDADGNVDKPELAEGVEWDKETMGAAWEACAEHLEGFTFEKERVDVSEQVDQLVALATCLREKGYDVDDPTAETLEQWWGDLKFSIDWEDPGASADYEECSGGAFGKGSGK
jgi:hypothetical protein